MHFDNRLFWGESGRIFHTVTKWSRFPLDVEKHVSFARLGQFPIHDDSSRSKGLLAVSTGVSQTILLELRVYAKMATWSG